MDNHCGKFSDCSFSCFGSVVQTHRHIDKHTDTHSDADERFTSAILIGVSNKLARYRDAVYTVKDGDSENPVTFTPPNRKSSMLSAFIVYNGHVIQVA